MKLRAAALLISLAAAPAGGDILLGLPIDCIPGDTCFIQNYVDRDPGPGAADFTCGALSYDGHKGTDFALATEAEMMRGVAVLAAAPGTVRAIRDGMPDNGPRTAPPEGMDCGNGVVIDHGAGWQTQYCHLAEGSVAVQPGQRVAKGTVLGRVGLSGRTAFPHVHLSVRQDGNVIDPFQPGAPVTCTTPSAPDETLWQNPPDYRASGLIGAGLTTEVPSFDAVKAGPAMPDALPSGATALVAWVHLFGAQAGDRIEFTLTGPEGRFAEHAQTIDRTQARIYRAFGKRHPPGGWPKGAYEAKIALIRAGQTIDTITVAVTVR
ncbi:peptidase M23-like protein [Rhodovulum bhavnagarense]|uniref:Peptidase M23-like protein n=1 Tax=Rhodovulum bhavnagarense TaxID=992286 RepID=A0A4R2RT48_9RHOB|nr:M23 family metallopeptidase [Rhodovulum bhavnagarense]TCP63061.1 peptidase M23-like protein [Rhodovulum bhavnagarense]